MPFRDSIPLQEYAPGLASILDKLQGVQITKGNPDLDQKDPHRVYTWVASHKRIKSDPRNLALFLHKGSTFRNRADISDILGTANKKVRAAEPEELQTIGMSPQYCHPFPNLEFIQNGAITHFVLDRNLTLMQESCFFPIYSPEERIATAHIKPIDYLTAMQTITSGGSGQVIEEAFTGYK